MDQRVFDLLMNRGLTRGSVVQSLAGHDRLQAYLVLKVEGCFVWLADGRSRQHECPKKKRIRHVRPLGVLTEPGLLDQIDSLGDAGQRDAALRQLLNNFLATNPLKEET